MAEFTPTQKTINLEHRAKVTVYHTDGSVDDKPADDSNNTYAQGDIIYDAATHTTYEIGSDGDATVIGDRGPGKETAVTTDDWCAADKNSQRSFFSRLFGGKSQVQKDAIRKDQTIAAFGDNAPGSESYGGATTPVEPGTPTSGAPTSGTPTSGTPTSGTPTSGTPTSGTPTSGTPTSGTPTSGTPTSGTPTSGTPTSVTPWTFQANSQDRVHNPDTGASDDGVKLSDVSAASASEAESFMQSPDSDNFKGFVNNPSGIYAGWTKDKLMQEYAQGKVPGATLPEIAFAKYLVNDKAAFDNYFPPAATTEQLATAGATTATTATTTTLPDRLPQSITATEPSTETDVYPLDVGTQQYQSFIAGMFMPGDFKTAIEKMDPQDQFFKDMASRDKFTAIYNDDFTKPEVCYKYFNKDGTLTPDGMVAEAFAMQLKSHDNPILFNKLDGAKNFVVANNPVAPAAVAPIADNTFNELTCIDTLKDSDVLFGGTRTATGNKGSTSYKVTDNDADLSDLWRVSTDPGAPADVRNAAKWLLSHPLLLQKVMGDDSKFSRDDMSTLTGLQTSEKTAPSLDPLLEQKDVGPGSVITTNAEAKAAMQDRNSGEMSYADLITWIGDSTVSETRKNAARYILAHPDYFIQICGGKSTFRIENMS